MRVHVGRLHGESRCRGGVLRAGLVSRSGRARGICTIMSDVVTPLDYTRARRLLMRRDPVLGAIIRTHGPCGLAAVQRDFFAATLN